MCAKLESVPRAKEVSRVRGGWTPRFCQLIQERRAVRSEILQED